MDTPNRPKAGAGILLAVVSLPFMLAFILLARHPEAAGVLLSLPSPATLACNIRCLGLAPTLAVLGEAGRAILLIFISLSFIYALVRTVQRVLRTRAFVGRTERKAVLLATLPPFPLSEQVTVFEDRLPLAFTGGFLKPRILVSTGLLGILSENELRAVILHEIRHRESRDPLKGLAVSFLSDFLFFLPLSRFLKTRHSLSCEMAADAHSVERQANPVDLASSLLKVERSRGPAAAWFFDPSSERLQYLLGQGSTIRQPFARILLSALALAILVLISLAPFDKSVSAAFMNHDKTCAMRSVRQ
jgi:Zn-dependent protease with chaperone function